MKSVKSKKSHKPQMSHSLKWTLSALTIAGLIGCNSAFADRIQIHSFWSGSGPGTDEVVFNGTNYHDGSAASFNMIVGAGGFRSFNLTSDPERNNSFQAWCVDVFHHFFFGITTNDVLQTAESIFGATKALDLGRLYTNNHTLIDSTTSARNDTAAFQLAVWEIATERSGNYNLTSGDLRITSESTGFATAQGWLDQLNSTPSDSQYDVNIWSVQGQRAMGWGAQDLAVFTPMVPEPETYAMLLAGLGLMGFVARRRKTRASV